MTLAHAASREPVMLRAARSLLTTYHAWADEIKPTWTVGAVLGALTQHERGTFTESARLCDAMLRDDRMAAVEQTRTRTLVSKDVESVPPETFGDDAMAQAMAVEFGVDWSGRLTEEDHAEGNKWLMFMGFAPFEIVWSTGADRWDYRLVPWHPQHFRYEVETRQWYVQTKEGEIQFEPGDGKWISVGSSQRPYMHGAVRSLAMPWLGRQFALRDWYRFSEKHGLPTMVAEIPAIADAEDKADFVDGLRLLSTESTIGVPTALDENGARFDLKALEFKATSWEGFKALIDQISDMYAVRILGHNLVAEVRGGSFAAAAAAFDNTLGEIIHADGQTWSTQLRKQSTKWWAELNFTDGADKAPWVLWRTAPPEDLKTMAEGIDLAGKAIKSIQNAGYEIADPESFGELFGIQIRKSDPDDAPTGSAPNEEPSRPTSDVTDEDGDIDGEELADHGKRRKRRKMRRSVTLKDGKVVDV